MHVLDGGRKRRQRHGPKTRGAHSGGLQHAEQDAHADRDGLDRRVPDVQHKKEEPVGRAGRVQCVSDGTESQTCAERALT